MSILFLGVASSISIAAAAAAAATLPTITDLFCRGWSANTIKVVPQNAIRLVSYEALKGLLGVKKSKTDT
jgi:hypothetical protein